MSKSFLAGKGGVPRTMYKLTVVALAMMCIGQAAIMYRTMAIGAGTWVPGTVIDRAIWTLSAIWPFLLTLCLLYWIPAALRRLFPEVSR